MSPTAEPVTSQSGYPAGPDYRVPAPSRFTRVVLGLADRSPVWAGPAAIAVCLAGAVGYTMITDPTASGAFSSPTCLLKLTTGFDCPGCGGTRAFWYLLHGNVPQAARNHAMFVFAVPFLLYLYLGWTAKVVFKRDVVPALRLSPLTIGLFLGAWTVFSVLRNVPVAPLTSLYV
ncbi:MAG: hypothetical protein QOI74_1845 [Micromonosporaceae bacterium]|jgi:hypothetical protein|nr:hypothetical protein [Micromonosporaceae bacterium]